MESMSLSSNICSTIVWSWATARSMVWSGIAKHEGYLKAIKPSNVNTTKQGCKKAADKIDDGQYDGTISRRCRSHPIPTAQSININTLFSGRYQDACPIGGPA